jgi:hypothetical protein
MTRQQVARRLGKSLATVRRLEGALLHPTRDSRGIHRFDNEEVEALAHSIERGQVSLGPHLRAAASAAGNPSIVNGDEGTMCENCSALERRLKRLRSELDEQGTNHRSQLAALQGKRDKDKRHYDTECRELKHELAELVAEIESLTE